MTDVVVYTLAGVVVLLAVYIASLLVERRRLGRELDRFSHDVWVAQYERDKAHREFTEQLEHCYRYHEVRPM